MLSWMMTQYLKPQQDGNQVLFVKERKVPRNVLDLKLVSDQNEWWILRLALQINMNVISLRSTKLQLKLTEFLLMVSFLLRQE